MQATLIFNKVFSTLSVKESTAHNGVRLTKSEEIQDLKTAEILVVAGGPQITNNPPT